MQSPTVVQANELVGFLASWSPQRLAEVAEDFPELKAERFFQPGIIAGPAEREAGREAQELRALLLPLCRLLAEVVDKAGLVQDALSRRLHSASALRLWCQILAGFSSGSALALIKSSPGGAVVACLVGVASSSVGAVAQWKEGRGVQSSTKLLLDLGKNIYEGRLAREQLEGLLPLAEDDQVRKRLVELSKTANRIGLELNQAFQQAATIIPIPKA